MTDLQHDIVAAFRDGGGPQALADRFEVTLPDVHFALRVALRESWLPAKPKREPMVEREYT